MKKTLALMLSCCVLAAALTACKGEKAAQSTAGGEASKESLAHEELDGVRFKKTRKITVEVFDRAIDGQSNPENNFYTRYIKEGMLKDHNVEVEFKAVPRWTEVEQMNNLLAAGEAPDVCVTYDYPTVQVYAGMGGIFNLKDAIQDYKDVLPNLWGELGDTNMLWNQMPDTGDIWALEGRLANLAQINTLVRKDWLDKLNLQEPTTIEEFQAMLQAFKENAEILLKEEKDRMIPMSISFDVGWRANNLLVSFVPNNFTDKDRYVYGFDDRRFLYSGYKEGVRVLNKWYNNGLIWKDFALYGAGDTTEDNLLKAGYVGAFIHNWDYPYRNGEDSISANLKRLVSEDAEFIAVDCFKNDAGIYRKYGPGPIDRKIFFPATNDEPLASLLYLDWISKFENRVFLQIGEEGVTHEKLEDGAIKTLAATGEKIMNSPQNIDYTLTINGYDFKDPELTAKSFAQNYVGVNPEYVARALQISKNESKPGFSLNHFGEVVSQLSVGSSLNVERNTILDQSIVAPPDKFDSVFDSGMQDYLNSGGQAIIDERLEKWNKYMGDKTSIE